MQSDNGAPPDWAKALALVLVGLYLFWIFAVPPILQWLSDNAFTLMVIGGIFLAGIVGFFAYGFIEDGRAVQRRALQEAQEEREREQEWRRQERARAERERKEQEYTALQRQRGLEKYQTAEGKTIWVPKEQLEEVARKDQEEYQKKMEEREREIEARKLVNRLTTYIEQFTPSRDYKNEWEYHLELQGYVKGKFPDAQIEVQTGSSRPDIVIDNIAIEVKGPTYTKDLQTIADKLMRYSQYYNSVIIVLFNLQVKERRYSEWECGIKNTFSDVRIVCIPSLSSDKF